MTIKNCVSNAKMNYEAQYVCISYLITYVYVLYSKVKKNPNL